MGQQPASQEWAGRVVLVTGGTGFLGAHLVESLARAGAVVHSLSRTADVIPGVTGHAVDVADAPALAKVVGTVRPSIVFHLAAYGTLPYQLDGTLIERTNVGGTLNLLEACRMAGKPTVVFPASCSERTLAEFTGEPDQRTLYSATKVAANGICQAYQREGIVPTIVARLFTAYGPGEPVERLIPTVSRAIIRGETPRLTAGDQKRDFVYVDDMIDALMTVAVTSGAVGSNAEFGTGEAVSIRKVVETLLRVSGTSIAAEYGAIDKRSDDCAILQADTTAATELTGWRPKTSLEDGLRKTFEWHKRMLSGETAADGMTA